MLFQRTLLTTRESRVRAEDLSRLADLHALLFALDDPTAAVDQVSALCGNLPVLEARLLEQARKGNLNRRIPDVRAALSLVGNRGLERVLLELLEDLTILKADLEDRR